MLIHSNNQYKSARKDLISANINIHSSLKGNVLNVFEIAAFETDSIVILDTPSNQISSNLLKLSKILKIANSKNFN